MLSKVVPVTRFLSLLACRCSFKNATLPDNLSQWSYNLALVPVAATHPPPVLPSVFPYCTAPAEADREFLSRVSHGQDPISLQLLRSIQLDILVFPKQPFRNPDTDSFCCNILTIKIDIFTLSNIMTIIY